MSVRHKVQYALGDATARAAVLFRRIGRIAGLPATGMEDVDLLIYELA